MCRTLRWLLLLLFVSFLHNARCRLSTTKSGVKLADLFNQRYRLSDIHGFYTSKAFGNVTNTPIKRISSKIRKKDNKGSKTSRTWWSFPNNPEIDMTSPEIIRFRGYPVEIHFVTTVDGYILELHRIPHGKDPHKFPLNNGQPVFFQHGFSGSSADWIIAPANRSLPFLMADLGYDVWLGNFRGNTYSRRHTKLSPSQTAFWNFSFDEMGNYDIPASLDYVLLNKNSSAEKVIYIGHSMGTAVFFICMHYHPEVNDKIETMIALAPVSSRAYSRSPVALLAPFVKQLQFLGRLFQVRGLLTETSPSVALQKAFCRANRVTGSLCQLMFFYIYGMNPANADLDLIPSITSHIPAGISSNSAAMFYQNYNSGRKTGQTFIPYDFGKKGNLRRYGSVRPPPYNLTRTSAPVYLFYSANDLLSTPEDTYWLANRLPNLKGCFQIGDPRYNHMDFILAKTTNPLVNDPIIALLSLNYSSNRHH